MEVDKEECEYSCQRYRIDFQKSLIVMNNGILKKPLFERYALDEYYLSV